MPGRLGKPSRPGFFYVCGCLSRCLLGGYSLGCEYKVKIGQ
ncbi:hypothetical protein HMPREF0388_0624 [Mobiluncus curtisii ATCC 51333]|uniref:Uncharacterized protein n=1 Tax=Mobiluncus curtisii ATCC 51333 TaxID=887326 RepID=E6LXN7_9ACTO|nr:hypothetical protein HMPREF0388_0624 [Mobiluncus curtisii ATCC 51333]